MITLPWRRGLLRLRIDRSRVSAEAVELGAITWAGEATYADHVDLADTIARLASEAPPHRRWLTAELARPPVQVRTLTDLPPVKPLALRALVAHQAARFFRRNGQPLVTDATWVASGTVHVARAAAVEEPLLEAIAAGARGAGLVLEAVVPSGESAALTLLPTSERARRERAGRRRLRRLAVTTAVTWLLTAALFVARLAWERRAVDLELARYQQPLSAVLAARRELRDAEATVSALTTAERLRGRSMAALVAITRALPDSAVLTSLAWSADGTGVLSGSARRAADVVASLDRAAAVLAPRLEGPLVRETFGGREWERFTIAFGERGAGSRERGIP